MDLENRYGTHNIQKGLLKLLVEFDAFCKEKGIKYSLAYGSLLGAVRHKGFIPWDDDLDIIVDRSNLNKLISTFRNNHGSLKLIDSLSDSVWVNRVALDGFVDDDGQIPLLDIFPIDNVPNRKLTWSFELFFVKMLQGMIKKSPDYSKFSLKNRILLFVTYNIGRFFPKNKKLNWYDSLSQIASGEKTHFVTCNYVPYHYLGHKYHSGIFEEYTRLPFENIEVNVVSNYDEFLRVTYGDYMTPPKTEDRIPKHK